MEYYTVNKINPLMMEPIKESLYYWKYNNGPTYINNLKYLNGNKITFGININNINYHFSIDLITNCYKNNNVDWILSFDQIYESDDEIYSKIFEFIDLVNLKYSEYPIIDSPIQLIEIIEKITNEFEFYEEDNSDEDDEDDEQSNNISEDLNYQYSNDGSEHNNLENFEFNSDNESDTQIQINNKLLDNSKLIENHEDELDNDHDDILNKSMDDMMDSINDYNIIGQEFIDYNDDDDDFMKFVNNIDNNSTKINYSTLRELANDIIRKDSDIKSNNKLELFKPEYSINIIINELKNIEKIENISLDINNIYDFNVIYNSPILNTEIIMNIKLSILEYPNIPPTINIIKPIFKYDINHSINSMDCFKIDNWNPTNLLNNIIDEITKLIDKYGNIDPNRESYSELSNYITSLSIISKINPKNISDDNKLISFQIPYVNCNQINKNNNTNWKSGTGYGNNQSTKWDIKKYLESTKYKFEKLDNITNLIKDNIVATLENTNLNPYLLDDIQNSCLIEYITVNLTSNLDLTKIDEYTSYYSNLIKLCKILFDYNPNLFDNWIDNFNITLELINSVKKLTSISEISIELEQLVNTICNLKKIVKSVTVVNDDEKINYINKLKPYQFTMISNLTNYNSKMMMDKLLTPIKLATEISMLSKSLPLDYESSIFIIVDESNIQNIHALIIPSHGTPYSNGCFLFQFNIPSNYPKSPPIVKLITTGNGKVRFNPNLYACGKVCLSLLGTWNGHESESWNENTSTILQVLISIQSLIFIDEPYFNEPGYERTINTDSGKKSSLTYNKAIKYNTLCYAMVDMLKNPPRGFEHIIKNHFKLKKQHILDETKLWLSESNKLEFKDKYIEFQKLLNDL
jgi:ubiquitin-protein ligase